MRAQGDCFRRQHIDLCCARDIDVEQELDAARLRVSVQLQQAVGVLRVEAEAAAAGVQPTEDGRTDFLDLREAEHVDVELAERDDILRKHVDIGQRGLAR